MFVMPAEWEPQAAVWLAWPHRKQDWPEKFAPVPWVYAEIVRHLARVSRVRLLVKSAQQKKDAVDRLIRADADMKQVDFFEIPTDRAWMRDSGPIFVRDVSGRKAMLDWRFNAWAKYPNHKRDDRVPEKINAVQKLDRIRPMHKGRRVVLEGGAIDVNGKGTLITTEECLLSDIQCRNPGFTQRDYEIVFETYLGARQILWLDKGISGDDTHGHVDDITRFIHPCTIITAVESDARDDNHPILKENLRRLKAARSPEGKPFDVIELPMPKPLFFEGHRLPASYANFLICNGLVLVPTFNDANDRVALNTFAELLPRHEIIGIHAVDLVWGLGTLHCMSQQEPL